jgi:peptide/nickel transport system permease protein
MRLMDIIISIPTLLLGLLILVVLSSNVVNVILAIGIVYGPRIARVTRSATLSVSEESYVQAAQARGESSAHILFREILPNVTSPIVVEGSVRVGYGIMIGTSLSFLGLGTGPPTPDWGFMIAEARKHIFQTPWFLLWPSFILLITIMSTNLIGDGLRDVLDPRAGGEHG